MKILGGGKSEDVVDRLVNYTVNRMPLAREDWQKAVFINGLLACGQASKNQLANELIDDAVATQTSQGEFCYGPMDRNFQLREYGGVHNNWSNVGDTRYLPNTSTPAIGFSVLGAYQKTEDERYLNAAKRQLEYLLHHVRRTSDGAICQHRGVPQIYIDTTYLVCPFLARSGLILHQPEAVEESVRQLVIHLDHLLDPRCGLCRHVWCEKPNSYPQSSFWSRGNGWVAAALVDLLQELPMKHPARERLRGLLNSLLQAVLPLQDASGLWHNILDWEDSYLETSGTSLFTYALILSKRFDWLDFDPGQAIERGILAVNRLVDRDGAVIGVSGVPGGPEAGPNVCVVGQGLALLMLAASNGRG